MMKLSSDNGSITSRRAAACRLSVPHRAPKSPPCADEAERREETSIVAPYILIMAIVYVGWWPLMLHTHCITEPFSGPHGPLLSPWPGHRKIMAYALRIKCILSLTARWHRCDASAISKLFYLPFVSVRYFLVSPRRYRRKFWSLSFSGKKIFLRDGKEKGIHHCNGSLTVCK